MEYYVDQKATPSGNGSKEAPFQHISQAASVAVPGDVIYVLPGIYREWVDPQNGGTPDRRITYISKEPLKAVITGGERISEWELYEGQVWKLCVDNSFFSYRNPYTTRAAGDWLDSSVAAHLGDVFLDGKSLYEVDSLNSVLKPEIYLPSWDPEFSVYTWYTEQDTQNNQTVLYANFHGKDPNKENVEISVRPACFYPSREGIGYITLSGFTVCEAATQWAPPTAYQEGMVGPHWSKGWIIEDCEIYESKCSGISLGKYKQAGNDNKWLHEKYKDGTQTERECICRAQREGWSKEKIGSHIVRRCNIHHCGQTGIVGHLGGVFSIIEDNHIHHINNKQNLAGAEIGGIKMHAAIDVQIRRNHFHHCTRGLWLDWQAQGTRVTQNLFHHNALPNLPDDPAMCPDPAKAMQGMGEDIFIEVSHGPTLVDNNLLLSVRSLKLPTQGVAVVHNLIAGGLVSVGIGVNNGAKTLNSPRYTPYHVQHQTEIAGFMTILHGDMRFYNNIFIQQPMNPILKAAMENMGNNEWEDGNIKVGTFPYDDYPTFDEWNAEFKGNCGMGSAPSDRYYMHLPVWSAGNVYCNGAQAWKKENDPECLECVKFAIEEENEALRVKTNLYEKIHESTRKMITTENLGIAFEPEQHFENPDGSPIVLNKDYFGNQYPLHPLPGPFAEAQSDFHFGQ